jgi:hypothetical protein
MTYLLVLDDVPVVVVVPVVPLCLVVVCVPAGPAVCALFHGCQTKSAISATTTTTAIRLKAAIEPPLSLLTTTLRSSILLSPSNWDSAKHAYPTAGRANLQAGANGTFVYAVIGIVLGCAGALVAFARSRTPASFYAADVYHMTARSHRTFAIVSAAFAVAFACALIWPVFAVPLLALYTLAIIFYLSSFARGFSGEDE